MLMTLFCSTVDAVFSQTYVNREWSTPYGSPVLLQWTQSIRLNGGKMATVGNTAVAGQGTNILLSVYKSDGTLHWSANYNTSGTYNDYGSNLVEDASGNIYVCGMTDNGGITNIDMVVLKYTSGGSLVWNATYNSPFSKNDIASSLAVDNNNNVYVTGISEGDTTQYDYITLGLGSNGTLNWASRYDYASLPEYALGIVVDNNSSLIVTGASASSSSNWDYTTIRYTLAGVQSSVNRNNVAGSGYDQPYAYAKDNNGNIYITGKGSTNGTDYDIKTLKLNSNLGVSWNVVYTGNGYNDQANAIALDQNQNVLVGGYETNGGGEKEAKLIKYDNSGSQLWEYNRHSDYTTGDAEIKAIDVDTANANEIYILIENTGFNNTKDLALLKLNEDGNVLWERTIQSSKNELATAVKYYDDESIWITYVQELGAVRNYTVEKYTDHTPNGNFYYNSNNVKCYRDNQLIVRFARHAVNKAAVDNTISNAEIEFADLSYYLTPTAYAQVKAALTSYCGENEECPIRCLKIFKKAKTTDTISVTRLGDSIKVPEFWASFILEFPQGTDIFQVHEDLATLPELIAYSHPNYLGYLFAGANEYEYNNFQYGLHYIPSPGGQFDDAHINIEPAWDIVPSGGKRHIRCGVFDTGINWGHEDFGYNGTNANSSKVADGWNFENNTTLKSSLIGDNSLGHHGTKVAGVIGAIRNNNIGIAGIAGGNYTSPNGLDDKGIALYSLKSVYSNFEYYTHVNDMVDAIVYSGLEPQAGPIQFRYGLNIQNHSWGIWQDLITPGQVQWDSAVYLLRDAVDFANRLNETVVCSRGNYGQVPTLTEAAYPACYDDDWVINVGGTGRDGHYTHANNATSTTMHGGNMDIGAPASSDIVRSLQGLTSGTYSFQATSAAAPHVSGVVGLLMSYMNDTLPNYKNLAPEDCEHIIELSATDNNIWWNNNTSSWYGYWGYDSLSGWGKLNAGKALQLVEKPHNTLYHFGTNVNSTAVHFKSFVTNGMNDTIYLTEPYENSAGTWFPKGYYKVNRYQLTDVMNYNLNANDTIVSYWARPSGSTTLANWDANKRLTPHRKIQINSMSSTACNVTGFFYEVMDLAGNPLGWWPMNFNVYNDSAKVELSILAHDKTAWPNGVKDLGDNNFYSLYPNPTLDKHTMVVHIQSKEDKINAELIDVDGRKLGVYKLNSIGNSEYLLSNNVSNLSIGTYYYRIYQNGKNYTIKFIKK